MKRALPQTVAATLLVLTMLLLGLGPSGMSVTAAAGVNLPRTTVPQGASVPVSGSGFTAQDTVVVYVDAQVNGHSVRLEQSTTTNSGGSFSTKLNLPSGITPGTYTLYARDTRGITSGQRLNVLALITLRINDGTPTTTVLDRQSYFVDVTGLRGGETVQVQASYPTYSGNTIVQTHSATANSHGQVFGMMFYAPAGAKQGWSTLTATGQSSNGKAQGRVYVLYRPSISLNNNAVQAGKSVLVKGNGFVSNSQIRIQVTVPGSGSSQTLTFTTQTDNNGDFAHWIRIPGSVPNGSYTLSVKDIQGGFQRNTTILVSQAPAPKPTSTPKPTAAPRPTAVPRGRAVARVLPANTLPNEDVLVSGQNFSPNTTVTVSVTFNLRDGSTRNIAKTAAADRSGNFATAFRVPYKTSPGTYSVTSSGPGAQASSSLEVLPLNRHPRNLNFRWASLWYHTVRQGTWDYLDVQSTLHTTLGIWVHVIFPSGKHHDIFTETDSAGHWATRFTVPKKSASSNSNTAYVTIQLWHGNQTVQSFIDFTLV